MDTYRISLVWQMYGHCQIDANSLEEAIEIALEPDTPLPDGDYVDDSVAVDYSRGEFVAAPTTPTARLMMGIDENTGAETE